MNNIDLDHWLAENVMKLHAVAKCNGDNKYYDENHKYTIRDDFHPTTNLRQAMECADELINNHGSCFYMSYTFSGLWKVQMGDDNRPDEAIAETRELAICEAIYKARKEGKK